LSRNRDHTLILAVINIDWTSPSSAIAVPGQDPLFNRKLGAFIGKLARYFETPRKLAFAEQDKIDPAGLSRHRIDGARAIPIEQIGFRLNALIRIPACENAARGILAQETGTFLGNSAARRPGALLSDGHAAHGSTLGTAGSAPCSSSGSGALGRPKNLRIGWRGRKEHSHCRHERRELPDSILHATDPPELSRPLHSASFATSTARASES
jgi:hypothetical protein